MNDIYTNAFPYILSTTVLIGGYFVYKYWPTIKRILTVLAVAITVLTGGYLYARGPKIVEVEKIVKVYNEPDRKQAFLEALEVIPPKYGIHSIVIESLMDNESIDRDLDAVKSESHNPNQIAIAAKFTKDREKQKLLATSWCPFQVMGYEAEQRGVPYYQLISNPQTCVEVAMAVWKTKEDTCKKQGITDSYSLLRCTAKGYNGTGASAEVYTEKFMRNVSAKTFKIVFDS